MKLWWRGWISVAVLGCAALASCCKRDDPSRQQPALGVPLGDAPGQGPAAASTPPGRAGGGVAPAAAGAMSGAVRVVYLHHSTGGVIWEGGVKSWLDRYNQERGTRYSITEQAFPKDSPYGWENYPFDYWNIWVSHGGGQPFKQEPTLEMLTRQYQVIVFKHCFPVSGIEADDGPGDVTSATKTTSNYKLQYNALRDKLRSFPGSRFIAWTGAALKRSETNPEQAARAKSFFEWVVSEWDQPGDNIFLWDFRALETGGGLYLLDANATGDSHPSEAFARQVAPLFGKRLVDVIEGRGDAGSRTGR